MRNVFHFLRGWPRIVAIASGVLNVDGRTNAVGFAAV